ncbi:unnamed protein product [Darwinula stevensoni]|uniref:Transporter n=1 Tax=Darwinula stevensoni TaxID=69355 RepID=A0A7R9A0L4_9CRUS|nr:unnamed protein product [Darwinula stevensoni]CAG0881434.1 unnamed protein product [Darwinula stevensoni]
MGLAQQLLSESTAIQLECIPNEDGSDTSSTSNENAGEAQVKDKNGERGNWSGKLDFFFSCVGFAVGLGSIWRFPYLCYRSGGGAFLIPYFIFLVLCASPLYMLELAFGQFANQGPITIWTISPLFKGLGFGMVMISGIVCIYYNVIITYAIYYMYLTFSASLPWATCSGWWNSEQCASGAGNETYGLMGNVTLPFEESKYESISSASELALMQRVPASEEFWMKFVLQLSPGIHDLGEVRLELMITLVVAWIIICACLFKGVKTSGKVVYFSVTFPYVVLIMLLVRGLTLPGAFDGIVYYLHPRWEQLRNFKVWGDAATQIFYSVGPAWGGLLTMASYNRFHHDFNREALIVPIINCVISVLAGFIVFAVIGFMAKETGSPIEKVVSQGPGLAFIVYPEAVSRLPISPLWAFLFFSMLFSVGLGSQFGLFECVISAVVDEFPRLRPHKSLFMFLMCCVLLLLGIPCVMQGGMYVLTLMDWYSVAFSLMIISFFEAIVIAWVYGEETFPFPLQTVKEMEFLQRADRFAEDMKLMVGRPPSAWLKFCWKFITPGCILFLLIFTFVNHTPVTYNDYEYPTWAIILGWVMALCSLVPIPAVALFQIFKAKGSLKARLIATIRPSPQWGPSLAENRLHYKESIKENPAHFPQIHVAGLDTYEGTKASDETEQLIFNPKPKSASLSWKGEETEPVSPSHVRVLRARIRSAV